MPKKLNNEVRELGTHIDNLRIQRGYSIREFATLCGISKSQVNELGNSGVDFRYSTLVKIAKGFNIPVSELVTT